MQPGGPLLTLLTIALASEDLHSSASTGRWTVVGHSGSTRHTHGGRPASLGHVRLTVALASGGTGSLTLGAVRLLRSHGCDQVPELTGASLKPGGLLGPAMEASALTIQLAPGEHEVSVGFESMPAYQSWCDRFAFAIDLIADGSPLTVISETHVIRVTPLHRDQ